MPAAGIGSRMRSELPKQYLRLNDRALIEYSLQPLIEEKRIQDIVVSLAADDKEWPKLSVASHAQIRTTVGGASRAHSVLNGLAALSARAQPNDWVLVHDAARPGLSATALARLIDAVAGTAVGGILALPAQDTIKVADAPYQAGWIAHAQETFPRSKIWLAQTPQLFRIGVLEKALVSALKQGVDVTDEASAVEAAGHSVILVEGDKANLKVTTPEDMLLLQHYLNNR